MEIAFANHILFYLRCLLVIIPCPGYIHPDEYFQSAEPMAQEVLGLKSKFTWEWSGPSPLRNLLHPVISTGFIFWCIKMIRNMFGIHYSAQILLILPRLFTLFYIYVIEKCVVALLKMNNTNSVVQFSLFLFRSCYVSLILMTRTFSNVVEAAFFALLLYMVLSYMRKYDSMTTLLHLLFLPSFGFLIAIGCFMRPTFLAYSFYPMLYMFGYIIWKRKSLLVIVTFVGGIFVGLLVGSLCMILVDHYYYSSRRDVWWPIVPLNFVLYNSNMNNLKQHGVHPRYLNILVNMFLLFGPLYFLFIKTVIDKFRVKMYSLMKIEREMKQVRLNWLDWMFLTSTNGKDELESFMMMSLIVPVSMLSIIPHQEPRYILPVFIPLLFVVSSKLYSSRHCSKYIFFWIVFNFFCGLWFGFLHQGGVYKSLAHMNTHVHEKIDNHRTTLIYWHTYMVPQHLLGVSSYDESTEVHDLGGVHFQAVTDIINGLRQIDNPHREIWLFCPSVLHTNVSNELVLKQQFFPHVGMEDINISDVMKYFSNVPTSFSSFSHFITSTFSLNAYHMLV